MKNILFIDLCPFYGGGQQFIYYIHENKYKSDILIIDHYFVSNKKLYDSLNTNNKQLVCSSYFKFHKTIKRINSHIRINNIDSVIFNGSRAIYLIPFIKHPNKIAYRHSTFKFVANPLKKMIMIFSSIISLYFANKIILLFENAKKEIPMFKKKIIIINNGIDIHSFSEKKYPQIIKSSNNKIIISIIARLHKDKGQLSVIDAINSIVSTNPIIELWLIGGGDDYLKIKTYIQINAMSFVKLLGFRNDIKSLLQQTDILLLPSKYEAFPFSLLEGMASGLPLIATNVGGNPDIIQNNFNGFLINYNDKKQLSSAIEYFMQDVTLLKKFGKHSRKMAEEKFDIKFMINKIVNL
jgi:glycosyltransferase involved in cell wall biosynthesis